MPLTASLHERVACGFAQVAAVVDDCLLQAEELLTERGLQDFTDACVLLGKLGRGPEPLLNFLQAWPQTAQIVGEEALSAVMATVHSINKSPNGRSIAPFLQALPAVARRLPALAQMQDYFALCRHIMNATSGSIHGIHKTYASPCLTTFLETAPQALQTLSLEGLQAWAAYGVRHYGHHPEQQRDYFALQSADSRAVLQRERHGTLLVDHMRLLDLYLQALWDDGARLIPYSTAPTDADIPQQVAQPYFDGEGIRLPDVYEATGGISGLERYRAALAHMAAHKRWSTSIHADNFSPAQRLAIECLEDARVDVLTMRMYPGMRKTVRALHPAPLQGACNPVTHSCLRHRLTMLSRALLYPDHGYTNPDLLTCVAHFHALLDPGPSSTTEISTLALQYLARTRQQSDQLADTWFENTHVDYRDDNRHLWKFHELSDDEESFDRPYAHTQQQEVQRLPPRLYPEWDYASQTYRPDWVSLYECLHGSGRASDIDQLLQKHAGLAKQLKRLLDLVKPQDKVRLRYQEDGSELDLDVALQAQIDHHCGIQPDGRITQSHRSNGRSIAVTLLLDLSESLNQKVPGSGQSLLELSQEAVALLAWSIEQLGDPLAIAGFHSNTRHDLRYMHLKGFGEHWDDQVKARLAAVQAAYSTRMGAAMRHAAHTLAAQKTDKKILLVLTDGRPSDVDVQDQQLLVEDARKAVIELRAQGICTYCISLDTQADSYVKDIFANQFTVADQIERLPEKLTRLFVAMTS
jgi:hypothetical protein